MGDVIYLLGTAAFFAAMLAYVRGCERLAGSPTRSASHGNGIGGRRPDRDSHPGLPDVHPAAPRKVLR